MDLKVSIITVCYNAENFIEQAINSVLEQTYKNIEYIIIDGKSNDNTISIINKFKNKIHYFISEPDNGVYDAMNKGIKAASGDVLYFLNSDDKFYDKYVVENIINIFQRYKDDDIVYGPVIVRNSKNETFIKTYEDVTKSFFINNVICHQAIFSRADVFKKIGLFNDKYKIVADYEWELRAFFKYNINRKYCPLVIAIFRDGGISNSDKYSELHLKEWQEVFSKYFNKFELYKHILFHRTLYNLGKKIQDIS